MVYYICLYLIFVFSDLWYTLCAVFWLVREKKAYYREHPSAYENIS